MDKSRVNEAKRLIDELPEVAEVTLDDKEMVEAALGDLIVSKDITFEEFNAALPKKVIIVDSTNKEREVEVRWDVRPFVFDTYKKPGEYTFI